MPSTTRIDLFGTSFTVQVDEDPAYLSELLRYLKFKSASVLESSGTQDPLRLSILTSVVIADELFKEKKRRGENPSTELVEAERIALSLIDKLDKGLAQE